MQNIGDASFAPLRASTSTNTYAGGTAEAGDRTLLPASGGNDGPTPEIVKSSVIDDATMRSLCAMDVCCTTCLLYTSDAADE